MKEILITGANGFIGQSLSEALENKGFSITRVVRELKEKPLKKSVQIIEAGSIDGQTCWKKCLKGVDIVIHLASIVHGVRKAGSLDVQAYSRQHLKNVNIDGATHLIQESMEAGVSHFIYMSSVAAGIFDQGHSNNPEMQTIETVLPENLYGFAKKKVEIFLEKKCQDSTMAFTVIRPPLVYGPGAKGNFDLLLKLCKQLIPLPFGHIQNKRSFLYIGNLVDAVYQCVENPRSRGHIFNVADSTSVATPELISMIRHAMGKPALVFPCPIFLLRFLGKIFGYEKAIDRLTESLELDIHQIKAVLGWYPPYTLEEGVLKTVK